MDAMVPVVSLFGVFTEERGKARLRDQLRAALADAARGRQLLRQEREWRERMIDEVVAAQEALEQARRDVAELREAYRRELESNGKLRDLIGKLRPYAESRAEDLTDAAEQWDKADMTGAHAAHLDAEKAWNVVREADLAGAG